MKRFFVVCVNLFITLYFSLSNDKINWNENGVQLDYFKAEPVDIPYFEAQVYCIIGVDSKDALLGDTTIRYYGSNAYLDPYLSWIKPGADLQRAQGYSSVIFNLTEYYSRKLEKEIVLTRIKNDEGNIQEVHQNYLDSLRRKIHSYNAESLYGMTDSIVYVWKENTDNLLNNEKRLEILDYKEGNTFKLAWVSIGGDIYTGSLNNYLKGAFNLELGLELAYKKWSHGLIMELSASSAKSDFANSFYTLEKNESTQMLLYRYRTGYYFRLNSNVLLQPHVSAGIGLLNRSHEVQNMFLTTTSKAYFQAAAGFNIDYFVGKTMISGTSFYKQYLRFGFQYGTARYTSSLKGNTISIKAGFGWLFGSVDKFNFNERL